MQLENNFTVPVPVEQAWDLLLAPERVAACLPGATLDAVDGDDMRGSVRVKLGPMAMQYRGTARFVERDDVARTVVLDAAGKESGGAGGVKAQLRMSLEHVPDGARCTVVTDLSVTGKAAQFGRGVLADVSSRLVDQFADRLAREVDNGVVPDGVDHVPHRDTDDALDLLAAAGWRQAMLVAVPAAIAVLSWVLLRRGRKREQ